MQRTKPSVAISNNTPKSRVGYLPVTVQGILGKNPDLSAPAPADADDNAPDLTILPEDHPSEGFAHASTFYDQSKPPFVITQQGPNRWKRDVFIAENGLRRDVPVPAQIVARPWDQRHQFWTLDMNRERIIVKGFQKKGVIFGAKWVYYKWSERMNAFEDTAIAYTSNGNDPQNRGSSTLYPPAFSPGAAPSPMGSDRELRGRPKDNSSKKPASSAAAAGLLVDRPHRASKPTFKVKHLDLGPSRKRKVDDSTTNEAPEKRQRAFQYSSTTLDAAYEAPRPTPKPTDHQSPGPTTQSMRQSKTQSIDPMPVLSTYKQNHTILRVAKISESTVPIRLRSCMTLETFFTWIDTATRYSFYHGGSSSEIMVTFDRKHATELGRHMLVKRDMMATFKVFLNTVNEAPCWSYGNGRCEIEVQVL